MAAEKSIMMHHPKFIRMIKSKEDEVAGHVACLEYRYAHTVLVVKSEDQGVDGKMTLQ